MQLLPSTCTKTSTAAAVSLRYETSNGASLTRVGKTSMTIHVGAWRRPRETRASEKVTEANFVFVALDDAGKPVPVRGLPGTA